MRNKTKMKFASGILVVLVVGLVFILANGIGFNAESLENTENIVYENDKHEEESFDIINTENNNETQVENEETQEPLVDIPTDTNEPSTETEEPSINEDPVIEETQVPQEETKPVEQKPVEEKPVEETTPPVNYTEVDEMVYATTNVNIRTGPGTNFDSVGILVKNASVKRIAIGDNTWSKVIYKNNEYFIKSKYLTTEEPIYNDLNGKQPTAETYNYFSEDIYFDYEYVEHETLMPYGIFTPSHTNGYDKIPLIISLHGASERGCGEDTFRNKFLVKEFNNWEMSGFAAYVVMPHLAGNGYSDAWCNETSANRLFDLIDYLVNTLNIDTNKIIIQGHSLGGQGVLYIASHNRACFSAAVPVSGYPSSANLDNINCAIRGYVGSASAGEDSNSVSYMRKIFNNTLGIENLCERNVSHDNLPRTAFTEDYDGDNISDLILWMFAQ